MIADPAREAMRDLEKVLADRKEAAPALYALWRHGEHARAEGLADGVDERAQQVDAALLEWAPHATAEELSGLLEHAPEVVFLWVAANADNPDVELAALLAAGVAHPEQGERARVVARNRIVQGPLVDALRCVPLLGERDEIRIDANFEPRARLEILLWEAGARALQLPELGRWIWSSNETFTAVVAEPARGSLRGRVLAARTLEVAACGMPPTTDQMLVGRSLQVLQPLLLHPEPMVWIAAARAFGRLAGAFEPLEGTLLDWVHGASPVLRQRSLTAFASLPKDRLRFLGHELETVIEAPENEGWVLAAAAAATPYLLHERRDLWDQLADRIMRGDGGAVAARALARGLATLWRRGEHDEVRQPLQRLRRMAQRADSADIHGWRRWLETIAVTDPVDAAERDPLDIETGLDNLVRLAAHYDDEEADARAARFAAALDHSFSEARRIVLGDGSRRHRAAAVNALEGCARSLALRLWGPILATRPGGDPYAEPELDEMWALLARAPAELLDIVRERRQGEDRDEAFEDALEVLALKLGGYALDACGREHELGPGRGKTAHDTCLWLRKLEGLSDGSRELPAPVGGALSALFWRLVDTTRGTALGEVDDVEWLGPFAAWWALVIDNPAVLGRLGTALPMIAEGALEKCTGLANQVREALSAEDTEDGKWAEPVMELLGELHADGTELGVALRGLGDALGRFADAAGPQKDLEARCLGLVIAAERLQAALADPVRALHSAEETPQDDTLAHRTSQNSPRTATMVTRAIRAHDLGMLDVWFASLGPTASSLVERAVRAAMKRTPPPPPPPKKKKPTMIVGYELVKELGEGGIGTVWLVRKPGADRFFVLKIPKRDVLQSASDTEREGILASFVEEAKALAGLYHPNVANIIDRGVEQDLPYLVLEYLIGADLKMYSEAKLMSLFELRSVVQESCAGLTALHNAGLVHRDIKPANIWLRLPLQGGEKFVPEKHRDPARAQPLSTVIIDFGMVRAQKVSAEVGGRFVAGTPGYIAPEQVLDPVELDGRADVYALAGTIYNVTTGRTFFDDIENPRDRIIAHMRQDPMEDASRFETWPAGLVKLMRAATAMDWRDRPTPLELGRELAALL